jgi:integrase
MVQRAPGVWRLRAYLGRDENGQPRQIQRTFRGGERAEAKELARLVSAVEDGKFDRTRATLGQLLDQWIANLEGRRRPSTIHGYLGKIEHRIRPALGEVLLSKLGADGLDHWYRKWEAAGLSPSTVRQLHAILHAALHQAVKWRWIDRNPAEQASPPGPATPKMKVPTPETLNELHTAARDADAVLASAIAIAALTGIRRGELVALRWSDVDLAAGMLRVERSTTVVDGIVHQGPTKTHAARRVALDEIGVGVFRDRWQVMADLSERAESPLVEDPYVLSYNANGAVPVNPDTLTHRFGALCLRLERAAAKAGRKERWPFRFHDLRHFSVTTLIAAGIDIRTVAERHGHAQATMTLNRYAHALPERDRAAAGVLGQAFVNS